MADEGDCMTTLRFAERMSRLGTESTFEVLARARRLEAEGRDMIHLEIGEPDFATPGNIIEAAVRAMRGGATHYTPASGSWEVREATARQHRKVLELTHRHFHNPTVSAMEALMSGMVMRPFIGAWLP
jgi:aspartate/methionine/tyrosine aminotransferase